MKSLIIDRSVSEECYTSVNNSDGADKKNNIEQRFINIPMVYCRNQRKQSRQRPPAAALTIRIKMISFPTVKIEMNPKEKFHDG